MEPIVLVDEQHHVARKPYVRSGRTCDCLSAPDGSMVVCPSCAPRVQRFVSGSREEPEAAPKYPPCAWCGKTTSEVGGVMVHTSGTSLETWRHETCDPYWTALQERLSVGGAHDCPEERESVKRWVDGLSPPVIDAGCHDCGRECDGYRCRDCERMVYSDIPRMALEVRIHDADLDKSEDWSAGATPGAEWP